jgi:hypothetical protein
MPASVPVQTQVVGREDESPIGPRLEGAIPSHRHLYHVSPQRHRSPFGPCAFPGPCLCFWDTHERAVVYPSELRGLDPSPHRGRAGCTQSPHTRTRCLSTRNRGLWAVQGHGVPGVGVWRPPQQRQAIVPGRAFPIPWPRWECPQCYPGQHARPWAAMPTLLNILRDFMRLVGHVGWGSGVVAASALHGPCIFGCTLVLLVGAWRKNLAASRPPPPPHPPIHPTPSACPCRCILLAWCCRSPNSIRQQVPARICHGDKHT